ncbi:Uncharacterised protein [Burkholderia pseudomallei]|nr:Uncharacterised protein [Burkholderia pseudomallei]
MAHRRGQRQLREHLRGRDADLGRRSLQAGLGRADVGPRLQQRRRHDDRHVLRQMQIGEREIRGRGIRRAAEQHGKRMARALRLLAQRGQARLERRRALPRVQHVGARRRAEPVARGRVARLFARERDEPLGRRDLLGERGRCDGGRHDVRGERAPRGFELVRIHVDALGQRAVRETRGAEQIERVARLQLAREHVVEHRLRAERRHAERALARRLAAGVDRRQQRAADLRAQLFARGAQALFGGGERRAVAQPFVDERVERGRAIALPPVGHRLRAHVKALREPLRGGRALGQRCRAVVRGRRHRGRRVARREQRAAGERARERDGGGRGERARRETRERRNRNAHGQAPEGVAGGSGSRSSGFTRNHAA